MIKIRSLTKRYGKLTAVDQLDLEIAEGELFGFIGPNGAGKTTTIHVLATLLEPTTGSAEVAGLDVRTYGREVRRHIGYMPDLFGVYDALRVDEYLEFFAAAYDVPRGKRKGVIGEVLELTNLANKREAMVGELSRGMQQRLSLARVLIHDPAVLLLDEPASGLDPRARIEVREILRELRAMGKTILLSSHILSDIAKICTSIGVINRGSLVAHGTVDEVLAHAGTGNVIRARVEGALNDVPAMLGDLEGIAGVQTGDDGELRISVADDRDRVGDIARFLSQHGLRIRQLDAESIGIEEAYLRLTSAEGEEVAS